MKTGAASRVVLEIGLRRKLGSYDPLAPDAALIHRDRFPAVEKNGIDLLEIFERLGTLNEADKVRAELAELPAS